MNTVVKILVASCALALTACQPPAADKPASSATGANQSASGAAADGVVVAVNDSACEPMQLTIPSGKTTFTIKNNSSSKLEWEILKGVMIVEERENIAPGLSAKLTATLMPGEYEMTCGLLSNPRGKLTVTDSGFKAASVDTSALEQPLAQYKQYVQAEAAEFVKKTDAFAAAVKAGDMNKAKSLYADARAHYERIEPIAELFGELDPAIDTRVDDFKDKEKDPKFIGYHRLEYALWSEGSLKNMGPVADELSKNVHQLKTEIDALAFQPGKVVGGAATLIEEVAKSKISGEEERYSHTDLSDFQANVDGAQKIVELFRAPLTAKDPALVEKIDVNLKAVNATLAKYKSDKGFATYDKLSEADKASLKALINALAEDLAKLRGTLGLA